MPSKAIPAKRSSVPRSGELAFLDALRQQASGGRFPALRVGIGDDCAILRVPSGNELAVTTDLLLEGTHFRRDWHTPESAGHRCLARGLSDLAATGARPLAAFLSLAIPSHLTGTWTTRFLNGLLALAREHRVPLAGGDTAEAPSASSARSSGIHAGDCPALFTADILLLGAVPAGRAMLRSGARPGDVLYVTGALGGAAAQLESLATGKPPRLRHLRSATPHHPQLFPQPRIAVGARLRTLATAAIDLSDGLATDLRHLCQASGVRAELDAAAIPIHALAAQTMDGLTLALTGGEDYELLFTARPSARVPRTIAGVPIHRIGQVHRPRRKEEPGILLRAADGSSQPLEAKGWEHFRSNPRVSSSVLLQQPDAALPSLS